MINSDDDARQIYMAMQRTAKFSFDKLLVNFLRNRNKDKPGEVQLRKLVKQGEHISSIEFKDKDTKMFEKYAKRHGITFSVVGEKEKGDSLTTYKVFFKAKNQEVLEQALKEYLGDKLRDKKQGKQSVVEILKSPRVQEKQQEDKEKVRNKKPEQSR